jgi:AmiR/NasT family two-component response regulator
MKTSPRIVITTPDLRESSNFADWMDAEGFTPIRKILPAAAASEVQSRACDLLIADITVAVRDKLFEALRTSPHNRRTPIVLVGGGDEDERARADMWHAFYVERPVDGASLVCAASMAMLEGRPVRRFPRKSIDRFQAVVNDVPAYIVDVSKEGLRLEIPRDRKASPPLPHFKVRIPMVGLALTVQRVWASSRDSGAFACGGALAQNRPKATQGWQAFVDAVPTVGGSI